jgi:hypothetical protein
LLVVELGDKMGVICDGGQLKACMLVIKA